MKVEAKIFKGIEYVQLTELPHAQREMLSQTINPELFIKLLVDGKIVSGCLQYKDYSQWYQNQFIANLHTHRDESMVSSIEIKSNLALNKV